jgi:hypothetical protein
MRSKHLAILVLLIVGFQSETKAQRNRSFIPAPLKIQIPFDPAWETMTEALNEIDLDITDQSRGQGSITTRFQEYSSGPLVDGHITKIGEKPKLIDGQWLRVRYQYEILIELINQKETLVTVYANIEAFKRDFLGAEAWVRIPTNGKLEEDLLTLFGRRLFGPTFNLEKPKKDFWERDPTYIPNAEERTPRIVGPERPGQIGPF